MRGAAHSAAEARPGLVTLGIGMGADPVADPEFDALMAPLGPFGLRPCLVVGVSGGPHSLALVLLADRWARARGGVLTAAICDHGLRAESAAEASAVATLLDGRGIAARVLRLGLAPGAGTQDRARAARLAALLGLCGDIGAPWLLLGHHRGDQAETVLLRALAGSAAAGLAGMAPVRPAAAALLLRPLLGVTPSRLEAVVAAAGLVAVRDPSNADPRFTRVRLRAGLADPGGEGAATQALAAAACRFAVRRGVAEQVVAARLAASCVLHETGFARLDLAALRADRVARAALGVLLRVVGGGGFAPPDAALARLLAAGEGTLGGTVLRRDGLLLREAAALGGPVEACSGALWDGRFGLAGEAAPGWVIAAAGAAARRLPRPAWMPAAAVPTLPALHHDGVLAVLPALAYPSLETARRHGFVFRPASGPIA
jgi:tRNA(Ile)-lysidine synthase